jgi:predicted  nucleic acid-binding Zn-ribbon protein
MVEMEAFVLGVAGAGLLAALAFRHLTSTLIKLNNELQETIEERRRGESERDLLRTRVAELEAQVKVLESRLEQQVSEIQHLHTRLQNCDEMVTALRMKPELPLPIPTLMGS